MCGRYGSFSATTAIAEALAATVAPEAVGLGPSRSIAPGADVAVVIRRPARDGEAGAPGPPARPRRVHAARWGLLPPWATDPAAGFRAFNARSETAATKPTFRDAMRSFRAVVPASCWYERRTPSAPAAARAARQSHAVRRADGGLLALAGLCSWWRVPERPDRPVRQGPALHGSWLLTLAILTRDAGPDLAWLHPRGPVGRPAAAGAAGLAPGRWAGGAAPGLVRRARPGLAWTPVERTTPAPPP